MHIFASILLDRFGGQSAMIPASIIVTIGRGCFLVPWDSIWPFAIGRLLRA
jgi:hypothetical protein